MSNLMQVVFMLLFYFKQCFQQYIEDSVVVIIYTWTCRLRKRYNLLFENDLLAERQALTKELKKYKDPNHTNKIEGRISWIDKQLKSGTAKQIDAEILAKAQEERKSSSKAWKTPFLSQEI